jgi:hypothetical protein
MYNIVSFEIRLKANSKKNQFKKGFSYFIFTLRK